MPDSKQADSILRKELEDTRALLSKTQRVAESYRQVIVKIHDIKEPGQFVDTEDTYQMVLDLREELDEQTERLEKSVVTLRRLEEAVSLQALKEEVVKDGYHPVDEESLRIAIDRAEVAERENRSHHRIIYKRGVALHEFAGPCNDTDMTVCTACLENKRIADDSERYMQELLDMRKLMRRSEEVMLRATWNRKMQDPVEIKQTEEEAQKLSIEMKNAQRKPLKAT